MKRILFLILLTISSNCFSQIKKGSTHTFYLVDSVSKIVNKHVTFVLYQVHNDTISVAQFTIYDYEKKELMHFYLDDIKKYYPVLLKLFFAVNIQTPSSSSNRSNVDNLNYVYTINFS